MEEEKRSRIRTAEVNNVTGSFGIKIIGRITNARIRELCRVKKVMNEHMMKTFYDFFGHIG